MKTLIALSLVVLFCFSCKENSQEEATRLADSIAEKQNEPEVARGSDLYKMGITHKVQSIRDTYYDAVIKFDVVHKDSKVGSVLTTFNDKGDIKEIYEYDEDGALDWRSIYRYNEAGRLTQISKFDGDGDLQLRFACNYDKAGVLTFMTRRDEDGDFEARMLNQYNEDARLSQMSEVDEEGALDFRYTYRYDDKGNLIRQNEYDDDGDLDENKTWFYTFDDTGNWTSKIEYVDGEADKVILRSVKLPENPAK